MLIIVYHSTVINLPVNDLGVDISKLNKDITFRVWGISSGDREGKEGM